MRGIVLTKEETGFVLRIGLVFYGIFHREC